MIRILHLSDPHFGAASAAAAEAFLRQAGSFAPDLTVLSGDLSMRARRSELNEAKRFVERLPRPLLVIPGNHDIPALNQPFHRFFAPFRRYRKAIRDDLRPQVRPPGIHAVGGNSSIAFGWHRDWSTGHLDDEELRNIDISFSESAPDDLRVLVIHHPLLAPPHHRRAVVQPLPRLLDVMASRRVDLVLCGHFHISFSATIGHGWASVVSQAATVCSTRLQGEPQGFHIITVENGEMEIGKWQFDGSRFLAGATSRFHRGDGGWTWPAGP